MYKYVLIIVIFVITSSCKSTDQLDNYFTLKSDLLPGFELSGIILKENEKDILYITKVRIFSNWERGWTEGFYEASGKYLIEKSTGGDKLIEVDPFELWDIVSGEIRYYDTYYRGDDGLRKVRNRLDRLRELSKALIEDMNYPKYFTDLEKNLYPILFPEVYNFNKLKREGRLSKDFYNSNLEVEVIRGNGINWRSDYTKAVFPKEFWELRDTGSIYRDALEAPDIFKSLYNLNYYFKESGIQNGNNESNFMSKLWNGRCTSDRRSK